MKRLIFALMLIVGIATTATTASAQKLYEYTYKESNHYDDNGPMNYHKQSKLVGEKLYFIYNKATDTLSLADKNGKVLREELLKWSEEDGYYSGSDWMAMIIAGVYEQYFISANGKILRMVTSDDDGYDIRHHYTLSNVREI